MLQRGEGLEHKVPPGLEQEEGSYGLAEKEMGHHGLLSLWML